MQGDLPVWNPSDWTDYFAEPKPERVTELQSALNEYNGDYQQWVSSAEFHPAETADHSAQCPVKTDRVIDEVHLASWI